MNKKHNIRNSKKCCLSTLLPQFHSPTHDNINSQHSTVGSARADSGKERLAQKTDRHANHGHSQWSILQKIDAQFSWSKWWQIWTQRRRSIERRNDLFQGKISGKQKPKERKKKAKKS